MWCVSVSQSPSMWTARWLTSVSALEFVQVVVECGDVLLDVLAFADVLDELLRLAALVERVTLQDGPVVEHTLRERLATRRRTQRRRETE